MADATAAVKALHAYNENTEAHERESQKATPEVRALVDELYRSDWDVEWLEESPLSKYARNRDPRNKSRFYRYLKARADDLNLSVGSSMSTYRFVQSGQVVDLLVGEGYTRGTSLPERTLRPLVWFVRNRYADRVPEVFRIAVDKAGSIDEVTSAHVREAVSEYKRNVITPKGVYKAQRKSKAEIDYAEARNAVDQLITDGDKEYWNKLVDFMEKRVAEVFGDDR